VCVLLSVGTARATVIGFDTLVYGSTSYTEDGYVLTALTGALRTSGQGNPGNEMYSASSAQTDTLSAVSGALFDLVSIELSGGPSIGGTWPQTVVFTGALAGGGSVVQSFSVVGTADWPNNWQLFNFDPGFQDLTSVSWTPAFTRADNITIVPEPSTALLLGAGIATLARRRRPRRPGC